MSSAKILIVPRIDEDRPRKSVRKEVYKFYDEKALHVVELFVENHHSRYTQQYMYSVLIIIR